MKLKVLILTLLFSFGAIAENTEITPQTFNSFIIPNLKKLVEDYYTLLVKLDPFNKEIISLKEGTLGIEGKWKSFTNSCFQNLENCKKEFSSIKNEFLLQNQKILKIEKEFKLNPQMVKELTPTKDLMANTISSISDNGHKIIISLDLFKFKRKEFYEITDLIKNIKLNLEILTTGFLSKEYRDNFYFIYSNFFKMVEDDIIQRSNLELFKREVVNLNINWNTFNMKVPKWKTSLSSDTLELLDSMHRRWNSILKQIWGR